MARHVPHILAACGLMLGCGGATASTSQASTGQAAASQADAETAQVCVMEIPGASLDVDRIEDGIALDFTTIDRRFVPRMRAAVRHLAVSYSDGEDDHVHSRHEHASDQHYHYDGFPDAAVSYHELRRGGRIELRATEPDRVQSLRQEVREEAEMMRRGACPLLPGQMG